MEFILEITAEGPAVFANSRIVRYAVVRNLEIIGAATKAIPQELKNEHPNIPWKQMSGLRDKLIHDYFHVDYEIVWNVIENELPQLAKNIRELLITLP